MATVHTGLRTVTDVIATLPKGIDQPSDKPEYSPRDPPGLKIGLAVSSMKDHMTDEGWQIYQALEYAGYRLYGHGIPSHGSTRVPQIVGESGCGTLILQDKREWDTKKRDFRDPKAKFYGVDYLARCNDIFKLTIVKDAQHNPAYHKQSADEIGCHAWIIYYHPKIVKHLASYLREDHCIRTYHTVDRDIVPGYNQYMRSGCLISGAVSTAYPLRQRILMNTNRLPLVAVKKHPGYHRKGSDTPNFLQELSRYQIAICTSSIYGYALRKIIEATACGCVVITDLPTDERLPWIDDNLIRVSPLVSIEALREILEWQYMEYDEEKQAYYADLAKSYYDYRSMGITLAHDIEQMRSSYNK